MSLVKKWVITIAIAIVLNLFVNYAVSVFYEEPQYNDYCPDQGRYPYPAKPYPEYTPQNCSFLPVGEELQGNCSQQKGGIMYKYNLTTGCPAEAYCETCGTAYNDVMQNRQSNIFLILILFGAAALVAGVVIKEESVANGFLFGGVLSLIIAAIRNWSNLQDVFKLAILGLVLLILIWVGYRQGKPLIPRMKK